MSTTSVWIGPTKCDANRETRTRIVEKIWGKVAKSPNLALAHLTLGGALDLFRESLSAFQNGGFMASTLLCRAATETALYLAISRPSPSPPPSTIEIDFEYIRASWGKIRHKSEEMGILSDGDLVDLAKIRERGNFAAHYGQIFDERINSSVDAIERELRLWADAEEAEDSLRKTATILGKIIARIQKSKPA